MPRKKLRNPAVIAAALACAAVLNACETPGLSFGPQAGEEGATPAAQATPDGGDAPSGTGNQTTGKIGCVEYDFSVNPPEIYPGDKVAFEWVLRNLCDMPALVQGSFKVQVENATGGLFTVTGEQSAANFGKTLTITPGTSATASQSVGALYFDAAAHADFVTGEQFRAKGIFSGTLRLGTETVQEFVTDPIAFRIILEGLVTP